MTLVVFIIAATEAAIWGTITTRISGGLTSAGLIVGALVFILMWIIDANLVCLDVSPALRHDFKITRNTEDKLYALLENFWSKKSLILGILVRVGIVSIGAFATAPNAPLAFADGQLTRILRQTAEQKRQEQLFELQTAFTAKEAKLQSDYDEKHAQYRAEYLCKAIDLNGKLIRGTGRCGKGPIADTLLVAANQARSTLEEARESFKEELISLRKMPWKKILERAGTSADSIEVRKAILEKHALLSRLGDMAMFFVIMLFSSLLLLKVLQPKSVFIYYNEELQQAWQRYSAGDFQRLEPNRDPRPQTMTPFVFEHKYYDEYIKILAREKGERDIYLRAEDYEGLEREILCRVATLGEELSSIKSRTQELEKAAFELELRETSERRSLSNIERRIQRYSSAQWSEERVRLLEEYKLEEEHYRRQIAASVGAVKQLRADIAALHDEASRRNTELSRYSSQLDDIREKLASVNEELIEFFDRRDIAPSPRDAECSLSNHARAASGSTSERNAHLTRRRPADDNHIHRHDDLSSPKRQGPSSGTPGQDSVDRMFRQQTDARLAEALKSRSGTSARVRSQRAQSKPQELGSQSCLSENPPDSNGSDFPVSSPTQRILVPSPTDFGVKVLRPDEVN